MNKIDQIIKEEDGSIRMTPHNIMAIAIQDKLYDIPDLNSKLYLHFKGFKKIENLDAYINLKIIWLENNDIKKIENLDFLTQLNTLFLHNNKISKIENLDKLYNLKILNLSHNYIKNIENLHNLLNLQNLDLSFNQIENYDGIKGLLSCDWITNLDLSENLFDYNDEIFQLFPQIQKLACLYLKNTQFMRNCTNYRKKMVIHNQNLNYLDERPINFEERRLTEAWKNGGKDAEQQERIKMNNEKKQKQKEYAQGLLKNKDQLKQQRQIQFQKAIQLAQQEIQRLKDNIQQHKKNGMNDAYIQLIQDEINIHIDKIKEIQQFQNNQEVPYLEGNLQSEILQSEIQKNDIFEQVDQQNNILDELD